jgi:diguanylate cyclase (GGDEF)-like protein
MEATVASLDERRVAETRARAPRPPAGRERTANLVNGALVLAAALGLALLGPAEGGPALATVAFVVAYACAARVEFEVNAGAAVPTQLVFVPMLLVLPPAFVPLAVAAGLVLSNAPAYVGGHIHPERALAVVTSSAYAFGPALVLLAYGSQPIGWEHWPLYVALVAAQGAADFLHTTVRERIVLGIGPGELLRPMAWVYGIDLLLTPSALLFAFAIADAPASVLAVVPLVALLGLFGRERRSRIDHALELDGALRANERLDHLVRSDPLTGLANRRAWEDDLPALLENARAAGRPLFVAMLDLDHFKRFNDAHGHPAGDALLVATAVAWREALRPGDLLARIGGEEFALALPGCGLAEAERLADRLRGAMPYGQTCSIGIAAWSEPETARQLVARADEALYRAKADGRDRAVIVRTDGVERFPRRRAQGLSAPGAASA